MLQNYSFQIAIAVFFVSLIASRYLMLNAVKKLDDEDKAKLLSSGIINASQTRMLIVFGMLAVYYLAITKYPQYAKELLTGFAVFLVAGRIVAFINQKRKLDDLQMPQDYKRTFITSSLTYNFGLVVFFLLLIKDFL